MLLLFLTEAGAQNIKGIITDCSTNEALSGVVVTLSKPSRATSSDKDGRFTFSNLTEGEYEIHCSFLGLHTETKQVKLVKGQEVELFICMKNNENELGEVVVSARHERREVTDAKRQGVPVSVINGDDFAARGTSIAELLNHQTGVKLRYTGGVGSDSKINVRGLEGNRVQIYIDGLPLNTPDGSFSINDIPLQFIDRIEIYKGIVPPEFGGDGLGGAINVVTIDPEKGFYDVGYSFQSYNVNTGSATLKHVFPGTKTYFSLYSTFTHALNNYTMDSPYVNGLKIKRDHDKYQNYSFAATIGSNDKYFDEAELELFIYRNLKEIQGVKTNIRHARNDGWIFGASPKLEKEKFLTEDLDLKLSGTFAYNISHQKDTSMYIYDFEGRKTPTQHGGEIGSIPKLSDDRYYDYRYNLNLKYRLLSQMSVNLNNDFRSVHTTIDDPVADELMGTKFSGEKSDLLGLITSLSLENKWFNNKVASLITGRHYFYYLYGNMVNQMYGQGDVLYANRNDNYWGASISFRYDFVPNWLLKVAAEHNYRLPKKDEILGDRVTLMANPKLEPEQANNYNIGIMYDKYYRSFSRLQLDANAYAIQVKNMMQIRTNGGYNSYYNIGKALLYGIDGEIKWDINKEWYTSLNATWQKSIDKTQYVPGTNAESATYDMQLPHIPIFYMNWMLDYRKENLFRKGQYNRFYYEGSFTDKYYYGFKLSDNQSYSIPSTCIHTLGLEYAIKNRSLTFAVECNNIFDTNQITSFNYPMPGRTFQLKFRWTTLRR